MFFQADNRFVAYRPDGEKITFRRAFDTIVFEPSEVVIPNSGGTRESFTVPAAAIEQGVAMGYRFLQDQLARRQARFVYQDEQRATNLQGGSFRLPVITCSSFIYPGSNKEVARRIEFKPLHLRGTQTFAYQLTRLDLHYAKAKPSKWSDVFDYTIQLTLHFVRGGELIDRPLKPLVVQSVGFGAHDLSEQQLYSPPIPLLEDSCLAEVSMTVVETNPAQVNTANVLKLLTENEERVKDKIVSVLQQLLSPK
ncbi:hypothetical protein GGR26_003057 [Lewinella marina]|uniref:Uncharacterized protein n=1 Tax=Neolewinella marina TaxID=438751 RepID=A0A2G0CEJ6_9BACT|nr:hypothetical protein [Neolewinella marina]NJB87277.1 hypothetical protein [Neolewinella marina]PHK98399.1 hypothetical protein CGL56_11945 [Neolewinella marina]